MLAAKYKTCIIVSVFVFCFSNVKIHASPPKDTDCFDTRLAVVLGGINEWKSAEIEGPLTDSLLEKLTTTDGTVAPLVDWISNKKHFNKRLNDAGLGWLSNKLDTKWSALSFDQQRSVFRAIFPEINNHHTFYNLRERAVKGLMVRDDQLIIEFADDTPNSQRPKFELEPYVEWATTYDGKEPEFEMHLKGWELGLKKTRAVAKRFMKVVFGETYPPHFQAVALSPLKYFDALSADRVLYVMRVLTAFLSVNTLFEMKAALAGYNLRPQIRKSGTILFSPLEERELQDFLDQIVDDVFGSKTPQDYQKRISRSLKSFVGLRWLGHYRNPELWGIEFRIIPEIADLKYTAIMDGVPAQLLDIDLGIPDEILVPRAQYLMLALVPTIQGDKSETEQEKEYYWNVLMNFVPSISARPFSDSKRNLIDVAFIDNKYQKIKRKNAEILYVLKPEFAKILAYYAEINYIYTDWGNHFLINRLSGFDAKMIKKARERAVARIEPIIFSGKPITSSEVATEVTGTVRAFLVETGLFDLLLQSQATMAANASQNLRDELKRIKKLGLLENRLNY